MNKKTESKVEHDVWSDDQTEDPEFYRWLLGDELEPSQPCYVHEIEDANETPYDPEKHGLCMLCAAKLWEIARVGTEFDRGDTTVVMMLIPRRPGTRE